MDKKAHWENVYETKNPDQVSWTQKSPQTSIDFIEATGLPKSAKIIDIGGGDSTLVDHLLALGYQNITVLDISEKALEKAKTRLGKQAKNVNWIVSDINSFTPIESYDVWHDRAAFHFLTSLQQIENYVALVNKSVLGFIILGTFSTSGPLKCSGLDITQYSEKSMSDLFYSSFEKQNCKTENHTTPFNTVQNFLFCSYKKR